MITRSKAAKMNDVGLKNLKRPREVNESLNSVDSGIVDDNYTPPQSQNHRQNRSKKKPTASRSQKNLSNVEKANNGSFVAGQQIDSQKKKSVEKEKTERKLSQCNPNYDWRGKLEWLQSRRDVGLWIQCCRENCQKWRFTEVFHDPVDVPEIWYCDMQTDTVIARCDYPEQKIPPHICKDLIENKYNAGSIVWARLEGFPWWPAMVDDCPVNFRYYELGRVPNIPIKYNVTWFAEDKVECSWIPDRNLRSYKFNLKDVFLKRKRMTYRGISYKDQVNRACLIADEAQKFSINERLKRYSFVARSTDINQTQTPRRSTGAHNRTCPVILKTTVAAQKEVCGDNSTIINKSTAQKTASTSRINLQNCVEGQKKNEKLSKVASNNQSRNIKEISGDKTFTRQNAFVFEKHLQTSIVVASDFTRPKSKIGSSRERDFHKKYPPTRFKNENDIQTVYQKISNNESSELNKDSCDDKLSNQHGASIYKINSQISVENRREIERPRRIVSNNQNPMIKKISFGETPWQFSGIEQQKSVEKVKETKRPFGVITNNENPRIKKVSFNESFMQSSCGSNCGVDQQINDNSKAETISFSQINQGIRDEPMCGSTLIHRPLSPVESHKASTSSSYPNLDRILKELMSKRTRSH